MSEVIFKAEPGKNGKADVRCMVGDELIHRDRIDPTKADDRKRYGKAVTDKTPAITLANIDSELIALSEELDKRFSEEQSPKPSALAGQELDVSRIVRPELITRPDFSALAVPRFVEGADGPTGGWVHYVQFPGGREALPIEDGFILSPDGERIYLSPIPAEPSPSDVAELCRWSESSRMAWLDGEEAPDTGHMLERVAGRIDRYVYLPDENRLGNLYTLAAWVLLSYCSRAVRAVPYIYLGGPAGSGKSTLLEVLASMVWRPAVSSSMRGATLFRTLHQYGNTLLLDEAEQLKGSSPDVLELVAMLLAGYKFGGRATRLEPVGDSFRPVNFDVYGPKCLVCIKGVPPALSSRCITIRMMRAPKAETRTKRNLNDSPDDVGRIVDSLHRWALSYGHDAVTCEPGETGLANRDAELWHPLLSIAAHTGDDDLLGALKHHAQQRTEHDSDDRAPDADPVFLQALWELRREMKYPTADEVLARAKEIETGYFDSYSPRGVASVLKNYGLKSKSSNGRKVFRDDPAMLLAVAEQYGYDLGQGGEIDSF